ETAEIAAIADAVAGQEETGVSRLRQRCRRREDGESNASQRDDPEKSLHQVLPFVLPFVLPNVVSPLTSTPSWGALFRCRDAEMKHAKQKALRNQPQRLAHCLLADDQLVCWIAESSQFPPCRRAKVQTSVTSSGASLPATRRPVVRSNVLSTSENRIATVA